MSRGRGLGQLNDWDPMREDFNDTSYDAQYPDDDAREGTNLDHKRLYIRNIPQGLTEEGLRSTFEKFGTLIEVFLSTDQQKRYGLVQFETPGEAKAAMMSLNNAGRFKLNITIAHKRKSNNNKNSGPRNSRPSRDDERQSDSRPNRDYDRQSDSRPRRDYERQSDSRQDFALRDNASTTSGHSQVRRPDPLDMFPNGNNATADQLASDSNMDFFTDDVDLEMDELRLEYLEVHEMKLLQKQRLLLKQAKAKRAMNQGSTVTNNRRILTDGRIVVNVGDRAADTSRDLDNSFGAGAGDSNERETVCSCKQRPPNWDLGGSGSDPSSPSTCVLCSEDQCHPDRKDKSDLASRFTDKTERTNCSKKSEYSKYTKLTDATSRKSIASKTTDLTSKKSNYTKRSDCSNKLGRVVARNKSEMTCDLKHSDFYGDSDEEADETNRQIHLRNGDYLDIVEDSLKVVIALAGYPRSKMRLRQMETFQRCLNDIMDMQFKNGLLKKMPAFLDYYLNRGAIVCICRDVDTRDWIIRISPGLQERMNNNFILLKSRVKRLCLAILKIPVSCWPASAHDAFKLLQYFNPTLRTDRWRIYAQKTVDAVQITSFLIDRVSGEIIRGPNFKNVIDYEQMEFELTGYTEIYYECLLSESDDDLHSVASRVKLLEELKSGEPTPKNPSNTSVLKMESSRLLAKEENVVVDNNRPTTSNRSEIETKRSARQENVAKDLVSDASNLRKCFESDLQKEILKKIKDIKYVSEDNEVIIWSDEVNSYIDHENTNLSQTHYYTDEQLASTSGFAASERTESIVESIDNLTLSRNSNLNIDSNRGIAYHRRTNYLHVEHELKIAITLEGYPQNKLEGTHIRRLKHLFKEYLHKDMKMQRFANLIIPKFQDIYLSNGAVIYICDSLETKDYLAEVLPKFINSTGLKLTFRDIKDLVRFTRVVMRLPKEFAHVESLEILMKLKAKYPDLKPDCWKYYSDVAGKQKRQFGVDPISLDIIKSTDFDPIYEGEKLSFRIIDRQKRDVSFDRSFKGDGENADEAKHLIEKVSKLMYVPIDPEIVKAPLTRIRTNHYSDLIPDDLKLYVGPSNYPETRIDETLFHFIKRGIEEIIGACLERGELTEFTVPKLHDMYLFDGVIFIICQNISSKHWIGQVLQPLNSKLHLHLISTEFRGAVGIVSMYIKTDKDPEEVIAILQRQNPRLRTKYWRMISTVRSKNKLDVVLQIDKLSALVITSESFNKYIEGSAVHFKLGHLQSLLKPKSSLEEITKERKVEVVPKSSKSKHLPKDKIERIKSEIKREYRELKNELEAYKISSYIPDRNLKDYSQIDTVSFYRSNEKDDLDPVIIEPESNAANDQQSWPEEKYNTCKVILKIPLNILPECKDDLNIIFDLLEDKNPGLNTELWKVYTGNGYPSNGKFTLTVDKQSLHVIRGKNFDCSIGGEKLKFFF